MRHLPIVLLAGVVLAGLLLARGCTGRLEQHLPRIAVHVLASPDTLELLVLDPRADESPEEPQDELRREGIGPADALPGAGDFPSPGSGTGERFHGHPVLGRAPVEEPEERRRLTQLVGRGVLEAEAPPEPCFRPRHGLRARRGERTVDLLISYECFALVVYVDGEHAALVPTDAAPEEELAAELRRRGLHPPERAAVGEPGGGG